MDSEAVIHPGQESTSGRYRWQTRVKQFFMGRPLAECLDSGRDNFLMLRLLAALMVIFGHSYLLADPSLIHDDPMHLVLPRASAHLVGVMMFFAISGFLITLSFERRPQLGRFLRARALRLWPALIVCVTVWAFVLGPWLSSLPLRDYFGKGAPYTTVYRYFWMNISLFDVWPFLPGVFESNPIKMHVNASLWTIPYEAKMYVCVAVAGVLGLLRFPRLTSLVIAAIFARIVLWPMYTGTVHAVGTEFLGLQLAGFFGAGSIACLLRRYVPISTGLLLLIFGSCLFVRGWIHETPFMWLLVGYFVFWFAYVPRLPAMPWAIDLSYGTYLWAFPLQQTVVMLGKVHSPLLLFAIVAPIALVIATASWLFIEKPALELKSFRWRRATPSTNIAPETPDPTHARRLQRRDERARQELIGQK